MTVLSLLELARDLTADIPLPVHGETRMKAVLIDPDTGTWGLAPHLIYRTSDGKPHEIPLGEAKPLTATTTERKTERSNEQ